MTSTVSDMEVPSSSFPPENSSSQLSDECYFVAPPLTEFRFWFVTVFGSSVAFISIIENTLLFYLFSTRRRHRSNHNMYMMFIAFFDILISAAYVCLMSVNVLSDYLVSPFLVRIWFSYMMPMITLSHIAMTSSSFLIVAASFERYCISVNSSMLRFAQRHRPAIAGLAILLGVISKGSMFAEYRIIHNPDCAGTMAEYGIGFQPFVFNTPYHLVWRFWYRNFVTVFAPFFILAFLNIRIVNALSAHQHMSVCSRLAGSEALQIEKRKSTAFMTVHQEREYNNRKMAARAATRSLVLVVCCYLISNIINVFLTIWEHWDKDSLDTVFVNVYAIAVDVVSLLTTLACAFRLPIIMACQLQIRGEIIQIVKNLIHCRRKNKADEFEKLVNSGTSHAISKAEAGTEGTEVSLFIPSKNGTVTVQYNGEKEHTNGGIPNGTRVHEEERKVENTEKIENFTLENGDLRMVFSDGSETLL